MFLSPCQHIQFCVIRMELCHTTSQRHFLWLVWILSDYSFVPSITNLKSRWRNSFDVAFPSHQFIKLRRNLANSIWKHIVCSRREDLHIKNSSTSSAITVSVSFDKPKDWPNLATYLTTFFMFPKSSIHDLISSALIPSLSASIQVYVFFNWLAE